jgi:hypothetical protein
MPPCWCCSSVVQPPGPHLPPATLMGPAKDAVSSEGDPGSSHVVPESLQLIGVLLPHRLVMSSGRASCAAMPGESRPVACPLLPC